MRTQTPVLQYSVIHMSLLGLCVTDLTQFILTRSLIVATSVTDCDCSGFGVTSVVSGVKSYICGHKGHGSWGPREGSIKFSNWDITELNCDLLISSCCRH